MKSIKLAIADNHTLIRKGLIYLLKSIKGVKVIFEAGSGKELIKKLQSKKPEIIITDLGMPEMDGMEITTYVKKRYPEIKVIALSEYKKKKYIIELIKRGADAYLFKDTSMQEFKKAIYTVRKNGCYYNKYVTEAMAKYLKHRKRIHPKPGQVVNFTKPELEILTLICRQNTTGDIAKKLFRSQRTIETHRMHLLEKTGKKNTAGLVAYAYQNNLLPVELKITDK